MVQRKQGKSRSTRHFSHWIGGKLRIARNQKILYLTVLTLIVTILTGITQALPVARGALVAILILFLGALSLFVFRSRIVGALAMLAVMGFLTYFVGRPAFTNLQKSDIALSNSAAENEPFSVVIQGFVGYSHRTLDGVMWFKSASAKDSQAELLPVDIAIWVNVINQRNEPALISNLAVKIENDHGEFESLPRLPPFSAGMYLGERGRPASQIVNVGDFLDNSLGQPIPAHYKVGGWLFLNLPKNYSWDLHGEQPHFVFAISDYTGLSYTTAPVMVHSPRDFLRPANFSLSGTKENLLYASNYSDDPQAK